jgi:predicted nucleic acid-binding protein
VVRKTVLLDTGFWIALYDANDQHHETANSFLDLVSDESILIPWPTAYAFLNTRFTRNHWRIQGFANFVKGSSLVEWIDDAPYRKTALDKFLKNQGKKFSLVDLVIREILSEVNIRIDYLVTFNSGDFKDVCDRRGIEIYNQ